MAGDPEHEKLDDLSARIRKAEGKSTIRVADQVVAPMKFSRIGFDFVGSVLGCTLLGWLADTYMGTKPWGVMVMVLVGFCVGVMNMWRALAGSKTE